MCSDAGQVSVHHGWYGFRFLCTRPRSYRIGEIGNDAQRPFLIIVAAMVGSIFFPTGFRHELIGY